MTPCGREFSFCSDKGKMLIDAALLLRGCVPSLIFATRGEEPFVLTDVSDDEIIQLGIFYPDKDDCGAVQSFLNEVFGDCTPLRYDITRVVRLRDGAYHCSVWHKAMA